VAGGWGGPDPGAGADAGEKGGGAAARRVVLCLGEAVPH
jgi:hypothetical protein